MGTALKDLKAPPGVSRDVMYQKLVGKERQEDKDKVTGQVFFGKLVTVGSGAGAAVVTGALIGNWPRLASFDKKGKVQTMPIFGAIAIAAGFWTEGGLSDGLLGAGMGMGLPFLFAYSLKVGTKIPGGVDSP